MGGGSRRGEEGGGGGDDTSFLFEEDELNDLETLFSSEIWREEGKGVGGGSQYEFKKWLSNCLLSTLLLSIPFPGRKKKEEEREKEKKKQEKSKEGGGVGGDFRFKMRYE